MTVEDREDQTLCRRLASEHLATYVSADDRALAASDPKGFRRLVADRIYDDLGLAPPKSKRPTHGVVIKSCGSFGSHRTGRLKSVSLAQIKRALVGIEVEGGDEEKVMYQWSFLADGHECSIWDYRGARWSTFGPREVFVKLFGADHVE